MSKYRNIKKIVIFWAIFIFAIGGIVLILRAYFQERENNVNIDGSYFNLNTPLELQSFEKFSVAEEDVLPKSSFEYSTENSGKGDIQWLKVDYKDLRVIGYLDKDLRFNFQYQVNLNALQIQVYDEDKVVYYLNNIEGFPPKLIFQTKSKLFELLVLDSSEYFTGYYYSATEKLFYISKGNASGIFTLFTFRPGREIQILFESSVEFQIIKANQSDLVIKQSGICKSLDLLSKILSEIDCSKVFLNEQNITLKSSQSEIRFEELNKASVIYKANLNEQINGATFSNGSVYFLKDINNVNSYPVSFARNNVSIYKLDSSGSISAVGDIQLEGGVKNIFAINNQVILINRYYGLERLLIIQTGQPISNPVNVYFREIINLNTSEIRSIDILGQDYLV